MINSNLFRINRPERHFFTFLIVLILAFSIACKVDQTSKSPYLVIYAFDAEGKNISRQMTATSTEIHLGREVISGQISGKSIVLAESGVGMTNAAMTLQRMIDNYQPQAVIMTGIAGAIDSSVHIGDITVCSEWIEHDYGYIGQAGFQHGGISVYNPILDSVYRVTSFLVSADLLDVARQLPAKELGFDKIGSRLPKLIIDGVGTSGNTFIDSKEKRQWLSESFNALVVDMESAAVAQVCNVNNIPFVIFRSASDLAGGSGSETARVEIEEFFQVAADNSSKVVIEYLKEL